MRPENSFLIGDIQKYKAENVNNFTWISMGFRCLRCSKGFLGAYKRKFLEEGRDFQYVTCRRNFSLWVCRVFTKDISIFKRYFTVLLRIL